MKIMFIHANSGAKIDLKNINIKGKVGIVTTIQHLAAVKPLSKGKFVFCGQILGCDFKDAIKLKKNVDKYLYIGTGHFHPIGLALNTGKEVYVLNPVSGKFGKLDENKVIEYEKKKRGAMLKFLNSERVGLLITLKEGQYNPGKYNDLKEKIKNAESIKRKYPEKQFYLFIFNTLKGGELENFKDIKSWVNMACPRLAEDYNGIVNFSEAMRINR